MARAEYGEVTIKPTTTCTSTARPESKSEFFGGAAGVRSPTIKGLNSIMFWYSIVISYLVLLMRKKPNLSWVFSRTTFS